jgi:uncharacterized protein (TIGR02145 family)
LKRVEINQVIYFLNLDFYMKYFLIPKLMLISKIAMSQIMLPAYQGVVSKIPTVIPSFSCGPSTVSDIDGNIYNTVLIGTQCWTKSNLKVTKYNDGTAIPLDASGGSTGNGAGETWSARAASLTAAYSILSNEPSNGTNATNYGFLYNWKAVTNPKKICPAGWHVPSDAEFKSVLLYRDVYNFMHRSYVLRKLENFGKKEFVSVENYTIEHVLPQNPNLGIEWQNELGEDWKVIQERYLHTIGNLTLTGYNSEYSDRPFSEKKSMKGGFLESPLKLNKAIAAQETWNEAAILERANQISDETLKIWQSPILSQDEIAKWAKAPEPEKQQTTYSIDDHEYLARPNVRELFDALRAEVMKMDPEVSETFLKYWIAYKVNTNFVDVVPKAKGLRLSINMRYPEISDPAGMTEDISEKGRWGNGDVSVHYRKLEDLPYIMGLIRQSYEKQLS